ncbi:MAG: hypothetical protein ABIE23_01150 [archaeon]|nr:hypothetical protein [Candidatus Micrarchaeota archaeon]
MIELDEKKLTKNKEVEHCSVNFELSVLLNGITLFIGLILLLNAIYKFFPLNELYEIINLVFPIEYIWVLGGISVFLVFFVVPFILIIQEKVKKVPSNLIEGILWWIVHNIRYFFFLLISIPFLLFITFVFSINPREVPLTYLILSCFLIIAGIMNLRRLYLHNPKFREMIKIKKQS